MAGLLGDVLPYVYSRGNALQRMLGGLLSDPVGSAEQAGGLLQDQHRAQENLLAQAFQNQQRPFQVTDSNALQQASMNMLAGPLGFAPAGIAKALSPIQQEMLRQTSEGWRKAVGDTGEFTTKQWYPVPVSINGRTINFAGSKNSGGGPLHLTRLAELKDGPQLITYKLNRDGDLEEVSRRVLNAFTPESKAEQLAAFNALFGE